MIYIEVTRAIYTSPLCVGNTYDIIKILYDHYVTKI